MSIFKFTSVTLLVSINYSIFAKSGCCSHHGGVSACGTSGFYTCNDGTSSPSCTCQPFNSQENKQTYSGVTQTSQAVSPSFKSYYTWIDSKGVTFFSDIPKEYLNFNHLE